MMHRSEFEVHLVAVPVLAHKVPVDQPREVLQVGGSGIAVVNVVGVFPDINSEKGLVAIGQRVSSIGSIEDGDISSLFRKPGPARSEVGQGLSREILDEVVNASPLALDKILEWSSGLGFMGGDAVPIEGVIPMLGSVIEDFLILAAEQERNYLVTMLSRDRCSHSVPLMRLLRLVMQVWWCLPQWQSKVSTEISLPKLSLWYGSQGRVKLMQDIFGLLNFRIGSQIQNRSSGQHQKKQREEVGGKRSWFGAT